MIEGSGTMTVNQTRAVLTTGRALEWIDVVDELKRRFEWSPVYWITVARNHDHIMRRFPEAVAHPFLDLNRGLPAQACELLHRRPLSMATLKKFESIEPVAMEMMDRMEIDGSFSYQERQRLYLWCLSYWLDVIEHFRINMAVFVVPPHSPAEYVLAEICRARNIPVRMLLPTPLQALHLVADAYDALPQELIHSYEHKLALPHVTLSDGARRDLEDSRDPMHQPWYLSQAMDKDKEQEKQKARARGELKRNGGIVPPLDLSIRRSADAILKRPKARLDEKLARIYKRPGRKLSDEVLTVWEYRIYRKWSIMKKLILDDAYNGLATDDDLGGKYIFLAMHYQPERTTCPDGGRFSNQFLMASLIARMMPDDYRLLIKEHPAQFLYNRDGEQSRTPESYEELVSLPRTRLIPLSVPTRELIAGSRAIATITGVAGWEALARGKPALVFGAAWYRACRGAYPIRDEEDLAGALHAIEAGGAGPTKKEVDAYVAALEDVGIPDMTLLPDEQKLSLSAYAREADHRGLWVNALSGAVSSTAQTEAQYT